MTETEPTQGNGISIVVPAYNEVDSLSELYDQITTSCAAMNRPYEIVFVNDGSTDGTTELLDGFAERDEKVGVVHLRRNFGKSAALAAGFAHAHGDIVVTVDADLQDDPAMIPDFVARIESGADLVSGWKKKRHDPLSKRIPSGFFNATVRGLTGIRLHDLNCGFKAYSKECIRELSVYGSLHRFLPLLASERGFRVEEIVVNHRPRVHGVTKFGAHRFFEGFLDLFTILLVTRFRTRPLHFFVIPGFGLGAIGFVILSYLSVLWLMNEPIGTRPLLTLGVLCTVTGLQFFAIGLMAELVVRTTIHPREVFSIRALRNIGGPVDSIPGAGARPGEIEGGTE
jgi:glycosyltransferase involved in cell wall biosynthesis